MELTNLETQRNNEQDYQALLARMNSLGYAPQAIAFGITWSEIAEHLSALIHAGELVNDETIEECLQRTLNALQDRENLPWDWTARRVMEMILYPPIEPDSDDEGPLTEQYELWSRAEDGWLEAAYEERFEIEDY